VTVAFLVRLVCWVLAMDYRGKGDLRVEGLESYGLGLCVIAMEEKKMGWGGEVVRRG
jgi:hypothetical protein